MSWGVFACILTVLISVSAFFDRFLVDTEVKKLKSNIFDWWNYLDNFSYAENIRKSVHFFNSLFDSLYGNAHFSAKRIIRSIISTSFALLIIHLFYFLFGLYDGYDPFSENHTPAHMHHDAEYPLLILLISLNFVFDFFSLMETRWILSIAKGKSLVKISLYIFLDFFLTLLIYLIPVTLVYFFYTGVHTHIPNGEEVGLWRSMMADERFLSILLSLVVPNQYSPYMWTTFFTSFIFYLLLMSGILIKALNNFKLPIKKILDRLYSVKNPITLTSAFIGVVVALIKLIMEL